MKKLYSITLALAFSGTQLVSFAQPAPMHDDMHKKMAAAQTDADRQKIMSEQKATMEGKHEMHQHMHGDKNGPMGSHSHKEMKGGADADMKSRMDTMHEKMGN